MKHFRSTLLGVALSLCAMPALAMDTIPEIGTPLTNVEMSQYRGGFALSTGDFINIGISIATAFNGMTIFNSHIANFSIVNGNIVINETTDISESGVTNVLQVGAGNEFEGIASPDAQEELEDKIIASNGSSPIGPTIPVQAITGINDAGILNIIQNTVDNSLIEVSTIVDIQAPASSLIENTRVRNRLNDAVLMNMP